MKAKIIPILIVFLFVSLSVPAYAQLGQFWGKVIDEEGNPIEGVEIRIEGLDIKRNYKLKTKKDGKYIHAGVQLQGTYRVVASKEGYTTDYVQGIRPSYGGGDERGEVNFTLKKGSSGRLAFEMTEEDIEKLRKEREDAEKRQAEFSQMAESFKEAVELYKSGQYEEALPLFEQAAEKAGKQSAVWANLAQTYAKLKRYDEGISAYEKAIELSPDDGALYQNMGNLYSGKGDLAKAEELYNQAAEISVAMDPKAAAATYYNLGVTYINSGKSKEASEALQKALEVDPNHAEAHYQLGLTLLGLNKVAESVEHLKKYVELEPSGPNAETANALVEQLGQ